MIKLDNTQDTNIDPILWYYGQYDYCLFNIKTNGGKPTNIWAMSHKDNVNSAYGTIAKEKILDEKWHHLVVSTDLQSNYCKKVIYLDGKKIADENTVGDFSNFESNSIKTEMFIMNTAYTCGALSNLLFFDRVLTEQEILWLYKNPIYPIKNYTF